MYYELKPCPFCGGEALLERKSRCFNKGKSEHAAYVRCNSCNARSPRIFFSWYGKTSTCEEAVKVAVTAWNGRV